MKALKSIDQEAAACRKTFKGVAVGSIVQHCHHARWLEILEEPAENRIQFILNNKAGNERATRLRLFRPFTAEQAKTMPRKWQKASAEWQKAYVEWQKASAERQKASAEWQKASAEWQKAYVEWQKASAERQKAYVEWQKASAERQKASADKSSLKRHAEICGCPWSVTLDIFGNAR